MNFKKLIAISEAGLQDSVRYLATPFDSINNNIFYRDNSPVPSSNSSNADSNSNQGDANNTLIEIEQTRRVLELISNKIKEIGYADDILTCDNWEDIISNDN